MESSRRPLNEPVETLDGDHMDEEIPPSPPAQGQACVQSAEHPSV